MRRLLENAQGPNLTDIRARALLLFLAVHGFRSSEVTGLLLSDFDWREAVHRWRPVGKCPTQAALPLEAFLRVLDRARRGVVIADAVCGPEGAEDIHTLYTQSRDIYSRVEIQQLLDATSLSQAKGWCAISEQTFRTLLLFLYGRGFRLGEALRLEHRHIDLAGAILRVEQTKFYKSRLVPVGPDLSRLLAQHFAQQNRVTQPARTCFGPNRLSRSKCKRWISASGGSENMPESHATTSLPINPGSMTCDIHLQSTDLCLVATGQRCSTPFSGTFDLLGSCRSQRNPAVSQHDPRTAATIQ